MKNLFFIACMFMLLSCGKNKSQSDDLLEKYYETLKGQIGNANLLSTYSKDIMEIPFEGQAIKGVAENLQFIKLKTPPDKLVGTIDKLEIDEDRFFVLDKKTNSVHIFDLGGNLITQIRSVGKGPGEYLKLGDFAIDEDSKKVILFDRQIWKMLYFDYQGEFLYEKSLSYWLSDFQILKDGKYVVYSGGGSAGSGYNILITTPEEISSKAVAFLDKNIELSAYQTSLPIFWKYKGQAKAIVPFNDTIYSFSTDVIEAQYVINFGNKKVSPNFLQYSAKEFIKEIDKTDYAYSLGGGFETSDYVGVEVIVVESGVKKAKNLILDKETGNTFVADIFSKDYNLRMRFPIATVGDTLITYYYAHGIASYQDPSHKEMPQKFLDFIETVDVLDNPILTIYKLAPFTSSE